MSYEQHNFRRGDFAGRSISRTPGTNYNIKMTGTFDIEDLEAKIELLNQRISRLEEQLARLEKILNSILPEIKSGIGDLADLY